MERLSRQEEGTMDYTPDRADNLYSQACGRGWWGQIRSSLTGDSRQLLSLAEVDATCTVEARRSGRMQTVPVSQIRGTEGRCNDFDRDFNPIQNHTARRWRSIAAARWQGKGLPAVDLVQVGDIYFVQDGHHRVSVARALGQRSMDAKVQVWQVAGPLPWESSASAPARESMIRRLYSRVRDNSVTLRNRALLSLSDRLVAAAMKLKAQLVSQVGAGAS